jgi:hypothetical protein
VVSEYGMVISKLPFAKLSICRQNAREFSESFSNDKYSDTAATDDKAKLAIVPSVLISLDVLLKITALGKVIDRPPRPKYGIFE